MNLDLFNDLFNKAKENNIIQNFIQELGNYLEKNTQYYIYCEYGGRSEKTCKILSNKGYNVINVLGGYKDYKLSSYKDI